MNVVILKYALNVLIFNMLSIVYLLLSMRLKPYFCIITMQLSTHLMGRHTTIIELTDDQLKYVKKMRKAKSTCQTLRSRCQIFLDLDVNHGKQFTCEQCAHSNGISIKTVYTAIQNYATNGLEKALTLNRGEGSNHSRRKVDGRAEANIIKLACGPAPEGHSRWTLRLLADKLQIPFDMRSVIPAICGHSFFKYFYGCKVNVLIRHLGQ